MHRRPDSNAIIEFFNKTDRSSCGCECCACVKNTGRPLEMNKMNREKNIITIHIFKLNKDTI